jgi:hypothetical protein
MMSEGDDLIQSLLNLISQRCEHNRAHLNALGLPPSIPFRSQILVRYGRLLGMALELPQGRGRRFDNSRHETLQR